MGEMGQSGRMRGLFFSLSFLSRCPQQVVANNLHEKEHNCELTSRGGNEKKYC